MNSMYDTLNLLECIPLTIFMPCLALGGTKPWSTITKFFCVIALLIFNILQLKMELAMEQSAFFSIFLIVTWSLYLIVGFSDFWHAIRRK